MRGSTHLSEEKKFFRRRWSTATLLGCSLAVGILGYVLRGRNGAEGETPLVSSPAPTLTQPSAAVEEVQAVTDSPIRAVADSSAKNGEERWRQLQAEPRTPSVDESKADCLARMAALDPQRAMTLALAENDFRLREKLRDAVLRGWAAKSPDEAAAWTTTLAPADQLPALAAVFVGAAQQPPEAVRLAKLLGARNPARTGEDGQLVLAGLTQAGAYESALHFAETDETPNRAAWLNATFFHWAAHQPENAMQGLGTIADPAARDAAFQGMVSGWAAANPAALADYAIHLASGEDRAQALKQTLPEWVSREPLEASEWMIRRFTPSPETDAGVAAVATLPNLIADRPEIAVGWAENIAEPRLRTNTLRRIAQEWALRDAEAVRRFITATPNLAEEERQAFKEGMSAGH